MIARKDFTRRLFLGGAGVAIGLPLFETFLPRLARGQAAAAPRRFIGYYLPNGMVMEEWRPQGTGTGWTLPPLMQPLAAFKSDLLVLSGLQNRLQADGLGDHAGGTGSVLTAYTVPKTERVMPGPSIDQLLADNLGQDTKIPSLQLGGEGGNDAGTCDSGYPCSFTNQISFRADGSPMPKLSSPSEIFQQLFEGLDPTVSAEEAARRLALRTSALDLVIEEATELQPKLSEHDRPKLEQYLTSVREVERRIQNSMDTSAQCTIPQQPMDVDGDGAGATAYMDTMSDLMAIGLHCDATRFMSFQWGNAVSNRDYGFINADGGHHNISHHGGSQSNIDKLRAIDLWEMERLAYFLGKLKGMQDLDGQSVLANTLIFVSSDVSDGDQHNHDDMPVLLLGQGGGAVTTDRHVPYDDGSWFAYLFLAIAQAYGVAVSSFGEEGTTPLPGLTI